MKLTIAIPTYNRPNQLKNTLERLLPQLTTDCFLLIIDNCSTQVLSEEVKYIFLNYPAIEYSIIRNRINIGGDSNIMRCFEYCETQWLWTLGDDDLITEDAVDIILNDIDKYSDAVNINYYCPHPYHPVRNETIHSLGKSEFIKNIDSFGASIFISVNIYNMKLITGYASANHNTYSCASQWLIIIQSLNSNSITISSSKIICKNGFEGESKFNSLNLSIARGMATLFDLPLSKNDKNILIEKIKTITYKWNTLEGIVKSLLVEYYISGKTIDIKFLYRRIYNSMYKNYGINTKIRHAIYNTMLSISPKLCYIIIRKFYLMTRGIDLNNFI
ncbi:glycosyltransferase family 2 protein [Mucilaginibacter sp.]